MTTLKPCPFCGGPARVREDDKGGIIGCFPADPHIPELEERCVTLYVGFRVGRRTKYNHQRTKSDAIELWNRRV